MKKRLKRIWNNKGYAILFTMIAVAFTMLVALLLGIYFRQNLYSASAQQINTKAYYLAKAAGDVTVAALEENDGALLKSVGTAERSSQIIHQDPNTGEELGVSNIKIQKDHIDGFDWIVVRIETSVPDRRSNTLGNDAQDKKYIYNYRIHVMVDNSSNRLYYVD